MREHDIGRHDTYNIRHCCYQPLRTREINKIRQIED